MNSLLGLRALLLLCLLSLSLYKQSQAQEPYLFVLGVVQDAGYPQIACYAEHCLPGWQDASLARGATSIALIDPDGGSKYLFEATPHLPRQLFDLDQEAPPSQITLRGIFVTHAHIGHYAGLMFLGHEAMGADGIPVFAMPRMLDYLSNNGPWSQLVDFRNIVLTPLEDRQPVGLGSVRVTPFLVPHRDEYSETVGYRIQGPRRSAVFIPDINKWSAWDRDLAEVIASVDYALLDASFFADGELGDRDMSQIPHPLVTETMNLLQDSPASERGKVWFIHMNHTNPLLDSESAANRQLRARGYNVAREGLRLPL